MNKKLIAIIVAVLLVGGGALYFVNKNKSSTGDVQTNNQGEQNFAPKSTEGLPFVATITTTGEGQESKGTISYDGQKRWRYVATAGGQTIEYIYAEDGFYTNTAGAGWYKFSSDNTQGDSGFDRETYEYSADEINNLRNTATYVGKQSCPAGTCDVWTVTSEGSSSTMYLDSQGRISQVEYTVAGGSSKIAYDYKAVSIEIPKDAQSFPTTP